MFEFGFYLYFPARLIIGAYLTHHFFYTWNIILQLLYSPFAKKKLLYCTLVCNMCNLYWRYLHLIAYTLITEWRGRRCPSMVHGWHHRGGRPEASAPPAAWCSSSSCKITWYSKRMYFFFRISGKSFGVHTRKNDMFQFFSKSLCHCAFCMNIMQTLESSPCG